MKSMLKLALVLLVFTNAAHATSPAECTDSSTAAFEKSDAVVLAQISSIDKKAWSPENAVDPTVINIKVQKYWKILENDIPQRMLSSSPNFSLSGSYILFLTAIKPSSPEYKNNKHYYRGTRCAPTIHLMQNLKQNALGTLLNLATKESKDVD